MILPLTLLSASAFSMLCSCADDNTDKPRVPASKITLTLDKYYNDEGMLRIPLWETADRAAVLVEGSDVAATATPIMSGWQTSMFVFNFEATRNTDLRFVAYYPADADVRCADGEVRTTVPIRQTGRIVPCMFGSAVGRANTYEETQSTLGQSFCTLFVTIQQGATPSARSW